MNDASGEHVQHHVRAVEADGAHGDHGHEDGEHQTGQDPSQPDPTRWWFASSAFPMIAGTLGPVASAFSICALVRPWRQHLPPEANLSQAVFVNDPHWLTAVNAIQLFMAIVSNLSLLLNMARRIRFTVAMPVTIVGWYLSSLSLVALVATAKGPLVLEPASEHIWSQAFFYGIFAAVLYFLVATLLVFTAFGAYVGHYDRDFQLTASQRTLMLQTIMFLMYLLVGALVFSSLEGWAYLDAVYWADVTLFTVGFGDLGATTLAGRALLFPYALVGIISLGLVIGSIRSLVLERGRRMMSARIIEKKRKRIFRRLTTAGQGISLETSTGNEQDDGIPEQPPAVMVPRENEFLLMRRIQAQAAKRRRWGAMGISTSTWAVLWLVGARVFQACEAPYQGWSYFDSVYFAFVSLTTIGYGDITPISNSGKAFFVFWSLLALPTTTVLISNAGDTIVKVVRDLTDRVGGITILPGDNFEPLGPKAVLRKLPLGRALFPGSGKDEELPPGFLGQARIRRSSSSSSSSSDDDGDDDNDNSSTENGPHDGGDRGMTQEVPGHGTNMGSNNSASRSERKPSGAAEDAADSPFHRRPSSPVKHVADLDVDTAIPTNRADYHVLLIDEIRRISHQMKKKPPRKFSFAEWAWYLRLLGEDASSPEMVRQDRPHEHHQHHGNNEEEKEEEQQQHRDESRPSTARWSWIGPRSPLLGLQDEAEWIHDKLVAKLGEELRGVRDDG